MHNAIMAEFGGSLVDEHVEAETAGNVTLDPDMSSETTGDVIELEEFLSQPQSAERMPRPLVSPVYM